MHTQPTASPPVSARQVSSSDIVADNLTSARDQANQLDVDISATQASSDGIDRLGGASVST